MRDEFTNPVRSIVGGWNAYDLWRTTIDVPRKVQRVATRDDDDDEDPHYTRRKVGKAVRKVIGAILLLLLLTTALALGNPNARTIGAASNHSEIVWRPTAT